jgi:predicted enzyme related to lactoylglutathione lyase
MTTRSAIHWFEIPVRDIDRASRFYEQVLNTSLRREAIAPNVLAVFAYDETGTGGCLMAGERAAEPAASGTVVYLGADPSLDAALGRVEAAGGRIVQAKTQLPGDMGCFAHVVDTEGNRVGLHAQR